MLQSFENALTRCVCVAIPNCVATVLLTTCGPATGSELAAAAGEEQHGRYQRQDVERDRVMRARLLRRDAHVE